MSFVGHEYALPPRKEEIVDEHSEGIEIEERHSPSENEFEF